MQPGQGREQDGGLAEAACLLQEGLQLLEAREREVDRLLEAARARARSIQAKAEAHADAILADADTRRRVLEDEIAGLRAELATLREEQQRQASRITLAPEDRAEATEPAASPRSVTGGSHASDVPPRWGRPASSPQAVPTQHRRRWPWS